MRAIILVMSLNLAILTIPTGAHADPDSCSPENGRCEFHCHAGDTVSISVSSGDPMVFATGTAFCGTAVLFCSAPGSCSDSDTTLVADEMGDCFSGQDATCASD